MVVYDDNRGGERVGKLVSFFCRVGGMCRGSVGGSLSFWRAWLFGAMLLLDIWERGKGREGEVGRATGKGLCRGERETGAMVFLDRGGWKWRRMGGIKGRRSSSLQLRYLNHHQMNLMGNFTVYLPDYCFPRSNTILWNRYGN